MWRRRFDSGLCGAAHAGFFPESTSRSTGNRRKRIPVAANNAFNTVQYSGINTTVNSSTYGEVTSVAARRTLQFTARYRF